MNDTVAPSDDTVVSKIAPSDGTAVPHTNASAPPVRLVAYLVAAPDDIIAYYIRNFDLHLFYRLPVLCKATREHFQLGRRLALAEAIGGKVRIHSGSWRIHSSAWRGRSSISIVWRLYLPSWHGRHSLFGPAVMYADGTREWWWLGDVHRDGDLPAIIGPGRLIWYQRGEMHRMTFGGCGYRPALIEWTYGPNAYVKCAKYVEGSIIGEWTRTCFDSDDDVNAYIDRMAGIPWRE